MQKGSERSKADGVTPPITSGLILLPTLEKEAVRSSGPPHQTPGFHLCITECGKTVGLTNRPTAQGPAGEITVDETDNVPTIDERITIQSQRAQNQHAISK